MHPSYPDPTLKMDRMYRHARHIYNATRKYYLLGRDTLLERITHHAPHRILEIGCGTARNLIGLANKLPHAQLFGLDASAHMLKTASRSVHRANHSGRIVLRHGLAEQVDHFHTFGLTQPFDTLFFSYSLSMIPAWPHALNAALQNITPNGRIFIVDFYDHANLPKWCAHFLTYWLESFDVIYRPELIDHLNHLAHLQKIDITITPTKYRYAFMAEIIKKHPTKEQPTHTQTSQTHRTI